MIDGIVKNHFKNDLHHVLGARIFMFTSYAYKKIKVIKT